MMPAKSVADASGRIDDAAAQRMRSQTACPGVGDFSV